MSNNPASHTITIKAARGRPPRDKNFCALVGFMAREIYLRSKKSCAELEAEFDMGEPEKMPTGEWVRRGFKGREWRRYKEGKSGMIPNRLIKIVRTALSKGWLRGEWGQLFFPEPLADDRFEFSPSPHHDVREGSTSSVLFSLPMNQLTSIKAWNDFVRELTGSKATDVPRVDHGWLESFWRNHIELEEPTLEWHDFLSAADEREIGRATNDFWVDKKLIRSQVRWAANKLHRAAFGHLVNTENESREVAQVALLDILKISAETFTHDASFKADFLDREGGLDLDRLLHWLATGEKPVSTTKH
jgi:hypothetical protein